MDVESLKKTIETDIESVKEQMKSMQPVVCSHLVCEQCRLAGMELNRQLDILQVKKNEKEAFLSILGEIKQKIGNDG